MVYFTTEYPTTKTFLRTLPQSSRFSSTEKPHGLSSPFTYQDHPPQGPIRIRVRDLSSLGVEIPEPCQMHEAWQKFEPQHRSYPFNPSPFLFYAYSPNHRSAIYDLCARRLLISRPAAICYCIYPPTKASVRGSWSDPNIYALRRRSRR